MSDYTCLLVTVLYGDQLLRCALKVKNDTFPSNGRGFWMEPEIREIIHGLLPLHVRSCGPVVEVEDIFEVEVAK